MSRHDEGHASGAPKPGVAQPDAMQTAAPDRDAAEPDATAHHEVAEYALLGLLCDGPSHGYRLAAAFAPDGWLAPILRLKMSQMYAYLHKLERLGWVGAEVVLFEGSHPRRTFTLTPAGARAFDRWADEPVAATRDVRLDFVVKLAFALRRDRAHAAELVARQRAATLARLERLRAQRRAARDAGDALDLRGLVLGHRVRQSEAVLAWLDELGARLGGGAKG